MTPNTSFERDAMKAAHLRLFSRASMAPLNFHVDAVNFLQFSIRMTVVRHITDLEPTWLE